MNLAEDNKKLLRKRKKDKNRKQKAKLQLAAVNEQLARMEEVKRGAVVVQFGHSFAQVVAAAVGLSLPDTIRGRLVLHFVDNQGALTNLVSGSFSDVHCRAIVFAAALQLAQNGFLGKWHNW